MKKIFATLGVLFPGLLSFSFSDSACAQYFIIRNGKIIGKLEVLARPCAQGRKLTLKSDIKESFIAEFNICAKTENVIGPEGLLTSYTERKLNGNTRLKHSMHYEKGGYVSGGKGGFEGPLPGTINHTVTLLYFKEPIGWKEVYSENHRQMLSIRHTEKGIYQMKMPDGKLATYQYHQGRLMKVLVQTSFGPVTFEFKEMCFAIN